MVFGAPFNAKYAFKLDQSLCELCDFVFKLKYMSTYNKNVEKKCMGAVKVKLNSTAKNAVDLLTTF